MKPENKVRRQLYLPSPLNRELKSWARKKNVSESEIMREALTLFLEQERRRATPPEENPVFKMKGIFSGDDSCLSAGEKHDDIVYDVESKETE